MNTVMRILLRPVKDNRVNRQTNVSFNDKEKIQLQAHKAMCQTCGLWAQSKIGDCLIGKWFAADSNKKNSTLDEEKKKEELKRLKNLIRLILSGISTKRFYTCNRNQYKNMKMIAATLSKKNPCAGFSISLIGAFTLRIHQHYQLTKFY
jgi:hypothetical protein